MISEDMYLNNDTKDFKILQVAPLFTNKNVLSRSSPISLPEKHLVVSFWGAGWICADFSPEQ